MKPHGFLVYLAPELYLGAVKLQADKSLGRAYSILYPLTEGLFKLGYITEKVYLKYRERYTASLIQKEAKPPTIEELKRREEVNRLQRHYSEVLKQWPTLREEVRKAHIRKAKKVADKVPNASLILALANGETVSAVAENGEGSQ